MKWLPTETGYAIQDDDGSVRPERYPSATEAGLDIELEAITDRRAIYAAFLRDQQIEDEMARRAAR